MKILLEIDPLQIHHFLEKVKEINGFMGIAMPNEKDISINEQNIWHKIKLGLDEIKNTEKGKKIGKPLNQLLQEIKDNA